MRRDSLYQKALFNDILNEKQLQEEESLSPSSEEEKTNSDDSEEDDEGNPGMPNNGNSNKNKKGTNLSCTITVGGKTYSSNSYNITSENYTNNWSFVFNVEYEGELKKDDIYVKYSMKSVENPIDSATDSNTLKEIVKTN